MTPGGMIPLVMVDGLDPSCCRHSRSKPLQSQGLFYFLSTHSYANKSASNTWHHRHQRSLTTVPSGLHRNQTKSSRHTKAYLNIFLPTSILISSTHSPITSLPIAITDAIGSTKSHHQLRHHPLNRRRTQHTHRRKSSHIKLCNTTSHHRDQNQYVALGTEPRSLGGVTILDSTASPWALTFT